MADMPWDACLVTFYVDRLIDSGDVNHCDELPSGWLCISARERLRPSDNKPFVVDFAVFAPSEQDGQIVRRILQRLSTQP